MDAGPANVLLIIADDLGVDRFPLTAKTGVSVPPMPKIALAMFGKWHLTAGAGKSNVVARGDDEGAIIEMGAANIPAKRRFYRTTRAGLSNDDRTGFAGMVSVGGVAKTVTPSSASRRTPVNVVIELDSTTTPPPSPPANVGVSSVTVSGATVSVASITRPSQTQVRAIFTIGVAAATGARNVTAALSCMGRVTRTLAGAFTVAEKKKFMTLKNVMRMNGHGDYIRHGDSSRLSKSRELPMWLVDK